MTPELKEILNEIGWQKVQREYPATTLKLLRALRPDIPPHEIKDRLASLDSLRKSIAKVLAKLETLDPDLAQEIEHWNASDEELCAGEYHRIEDAKVALRNLAPGHKFVAEQLEMQVAKFPNHRPRNVALTNWACALAEVWWLGREPPPLPGKSPIGDTKEFTTFLRRATIATGWLKTFDARHFSKVAQEYLTMGTQEIVLAENEKKRLQLSVYGPSFFDTFLLK